MVFHQKFMFDLLYVDYAVHDVYIIFPQEYTVWTFTVDICLISVNFDKYPILVHNIGTDTDYHQQVGTPMLKYLGLPSLPKFVVERDLSFGIAFTSHVFF